MFKGFKDLDTKRTSTEGSWLRLRNPYTGQELDIDGLKPRLLLAGPDSDIRREAWIEANRRLTKAAQLAPDGKLSTSERDRIEAECLAPTVLDWQDVCDEESGAPIPCTPDRVAWLLTKYRWAFEQSDAWGSTRANFLPRTAPNGPQQSSAVSQPSFEEAA